MCDSTDDESNSDLDHFVEEEEEYDMRDIDKDYRPERDNDNENDDMEFSEQFLLSRLYGDSSDSELSIVGILTDEEREEMGSAFVGGLRRSKFASSITI